MLRKVLLLLPALVTTANAQTLSSRFEVSKAMGDLPPITIDKLNSGYGFAQQVAKQRGLQGRTLWVDGTANLDRVSSDEKVAKLMQDIADNGFNTVVYDVKPISGQVLYKSKLAPKILKWKTQTLPADYDPLKSMSQEAKKHGLNFLVALNAYSEGHNLFKEGPGYQRESEQSIIYVSTPSIKIGYGQESKRVSLSKDPNTSPTSATLSVFSDVTKLPTEGFALQMTSLGDVVDGVISGNLKEQIKTMPKGSSYLVASKEQESAIRLASTMGRIVISDLPEMVRTGLLPNLQYPLMMNPHHPGVKAYSEAIVKEILANYTVDGIVYDDRLRYAGLYADFSPQAREQFEKRVGKVLNWPQDVFEYTYTPSLTRGIRPGPYLEAWLAFRAETLQGFVGSMRSLIKQVQPSASFGIYAGSWYGDYQQYGNNYAAPDFQAGFWFLTKDYQPTGFANMLDFIYTGCYYPTATIHEAMTQGVPIGRSVESAAQLSNRVVKDQTWVYAGISLDQFKGNPEGLGAAIQAACAASQGVMVFDVSHDIEPMWGVFKKAFAQPLRPPHLDPKAIGMALQQRRQFEQYGKKEPPVPIAAGSAGIGF